MIELTTIDALEAFLDARRPGEAARVRGAVLTRWDARERDLSALVWQGCDLEGVNLAGVDLTGSELVDVTANDACFEDARLLSVSVTNVELERTSWARAYLQGCVLESCRLDEATMVETVVAGSGLQKVSLGYAHLDRVKIDQTRVSEVDLTAALIRDTVLDGVTADVQLERAVLSRVRMVGGTLSQAPAKLHRCRLYKVVMNGLDLSETVIEECELLGCWLEGVRAKELGGNTFRYCSFEGAQLSGANASRCDLSSSRFVRVDARGSDLRGADLSEADVAETRLDDAKLDGADVTGVVLTCLL